MFPLRLAATALTAAALLVPAAGAQADGPIDVTGMSASAASFVDASTGLPGPVGIHAVAILGGAGYQTYDEIALQVRPVGGDWDPTLTFPHALTPVAFGGYMTTMVSTSRAFPPGAYEARIAYRIGETWAPDEALLPFTMP